MCSGLGIDIEGCSQSKAVVRISRQREHLEKGKVNVSASVIVKQYILHGDTHQVSPQQRQISNSGTGF